MSDIRISVVIPTYNREHSLKKCLSSLLDQLYEDNAYEIIIVDDGSIDNTQVMVEDIKQKHGNIIYIRQDNKGPAAAKNHGVSKAKGEIISFLDSDCTVSDSFLNNIERCFIKDKEAAACVGNILIVPQNRFFMPLYEFYRMNSIGQRGDEVFDKPHPLAPFYSGCSSIKKEIFRELEGFDEKFQWAGEDTDFGFRIIETGYKIITSSKVWAFHQEKDYFNEYIKRNYFFALADSLNYKLHFSNWALIMNSPKNIIKTTSSPLPIFISIDATKITLLLLLLSIFWPAFGLLLFILYFLKKFIDLKRQDAPITLFLLFFLYKYSNGLPRLAGSIIGSIKNKLIYL
jgi:glycosyltransferase involved in cell wall biosynthesis